MPPRIVHIPRQSTTHRTRPMTKNLLDKELQHIAGMDTQTQVLAKRLAAPGLSLVFLILVSVWAGTASNGTPAVLVLVVAAMVAGYMALNIGANDVANNVGPAVGARAMSMPVALCIAFIFEAAGALIAGGNVVDTVASGLLVELHIDSGRFVLVMIAALLSSAMWVHLSTFLNLPVSTTHSIIGAVAGAGISAAGLDAVSWPNIFAVAFGWVVSPVAGGIIAAVLLYLTQVTITRRTDKLSAARKWVPVFVSIMAGTFAMYVTGKALEPVWHLNIFQLATLGIGTTGIAWAISQVRVRELSLELENRKKHVAKLFRLPLIAAAALLSFAHGANDVANAVGPLAAIVKALGPGGDADPLPFWVLAIGAFGISIGLALFGPRLVRAVGEQITKLNEIRAFCASLSTALTVLVASALGMPVSTTHIAIGAVFGIGFLREYQSRREMERKAVPAYARYVDPNALNQTPEMAFANDRDIDRRQLVRRKNVFKIVGAWTVTVPCAALLSGLLFLLLNSFAG